MMLVAWQAHGQYDPDWSHDFRVGILVGFNISANFKLSGQFNVNGGPGVYDDGYVKTDSTGNAGGFTSNWSYNNASQYNAANQTLTMQKTTSFNSTGDNVTQDDSPYVGIEASYGGTIWHENWFRVGWDCGFGFLPISISDNRTLLGQSTLSYFNFSAIGLNPSPGIPGSFNVPDNSNRGAQLLGSTPIPAGSTNIPNQSITGTRTLDVDLFTLRLGPTVFFDVSPRFGFSLGAGPALGIVTGNYQYDEIIGGTHNHGQIGMTDLVFGGYVNASVFYHIQKNGDVYLSAQYMPLSDATVSGANREARLNLGGAVYVSAGLNWPF